MDKVEEYIKKLIKKANDKGAYYTFGKEIRSTIDKPLFYATIVWTKNQLAAYQLSCYSIEELVDGLKAQYRNMKSNELPIRYHKVQIDANQQSIKYHERMIKDYEKQEKSTK